MVVGCRKRVSMFGKFAALAMPGASGSLLPIFFMHGVQDNRREFDGMQAWIRELDPNVTMYSLPVCDDSASFTNLWEQGQEVMDRMRERLAANPELFQDGYTLLGHSQGALLARTVVERMDDHNIHTFIGLAGPQAGEYGIPDLDNALLQQLAKVGKDLVFSQVFLGPQGDLYQKYLSVANYWNDPREKYLLAKPHADYEEGNTFLPVLNNDPQRGTQGPGQPKSDAEAARYKANFVRLQHAVFTAGSADEMIRPWQSGVWSFYDSDEKVVELRDTKMWTEDWLGLRSLDEQGRLTLTMADNVCHVCWAHDKTVFTTYVAPHLPSRPGAVIV